ncbi:Abi family protein [Pseudomonas sp. FP597]|uniref:Abi family protein n=2 Tax=Pseudomonas TaxID=286 RepID=UPI002733B21D|nr:Abi family protein [Pseudomonas sp. FP597]WLI05140.1 Abi family protein [Pseudomonas sp. FP597]
MVWQTLEAKLSTPRMSRYLKGHRGNQDHAAAAYVHNMRIAESLVSIFHVLEVSLRNGIQREMVREYQRDDWYEVFRASTNVELLSSYQKVDAARTALQKRGVNPGPDEITAELSFGFWTSLFNRRAFPDVSKPLMKVFFYCPKNAKKAHVIRSRLNNARDLRNRCFHHEPLLW